VEESREDGKRDKVVGWDRERENEPCFAFVASSIRFTARREVLDISRSAI